MCPRNDEPRRRPLRVIFAMSALGILPAARLRVIGAMTRYSVMSGGRERLSSIKATCARPPWSAVAGHPYLSVNPSKPREQRLSAQGVQSVRLSTCGYPATHCEDSESGYTAIRTIYTYLAGSTVVYSTPCPDGSGDFYTSALEGRRFLAMNRDWTGMPFRRRRLSDCSGAG